MKAVLSDIHANLEAMKAVLADIDRRGIKEIISLGDIIGYGPNPGECIDLAARFTVSILGNHDEGALFPDGTETFNPVARAAVDWTRRVLEEPLHAWKNARRWDYLGELQRTWREDGIIYVHGSPRRPVREYIFPEDAANRQKMEGIFESFEHICFAGHTHIAGIFAADFSFTPASEVGEAYMLGTGKAIVNVGSVGQPRDNDPRACYAIVDGERVEFVRVEYDVAATMKKIYEIPELDNFLADRLAEGR